MLKDLWNKVDDYIWNNNVRVAQNSNYNEYKFVNGVYNKKTAIDEIIQNTSTLHNLKLGNFISSSATDITRNDISLRINFKNFTDFDNEIKDGWVKMGLNTELNDGYIKLFVSGNNRWLELNNLSFQNPDSFFNFANYGNFGASHVSSYTSNADYENTILYPKKTMSIGPRVNQGKNFRKLYIPDNFRKQITRDDAMNFYESFQNATIDYIRFGKRTRSNGSDIIQAMTGRIFKDATVNQIKWYDHYVGNMDTDAFLGATLPSTLELVPSSLGIGQGAFCATKNNTTVRTFAIFFAKDAFLLTNVSTIKLVSSDSNNPNWNNNYINGLPSFTTVRIKNWTIYEKFKAKNNWGGDRIIYDPNA